jgi:hypothetical protein
MRTSCAAIVALLACVATTAPEVATGYTTGGTRAPGPDLASGGVVAPDPAPVQSSAPKRKTASQAPKRETASRAPPSAPAPAPTSPTPSLTRTAGAVAAVSKHAATGARSSRRRAKRSRRHPRQHRPQARPAHATSFARIVSIPAARRLVADATDARGSGGRLLRAAIALFLVALAEGSLLLRLAAQLPRAARWPGADAP